MIELPGVLAIMTPVVEQNGRLPGLIDTGRKIPCLGALRRLRLTCQPKEAGEPNLTRG